VEIAERRAPLSPSSAADPWCTTDSIRPPPRYCSVERRTLHTTPAAIEMRHLQKGFVGSIGKRKGIPTIARWKVRVIMPDLAITVGPTNNYPFEVYLRDVINGVPIAERNSGISMCV
jgi:hypothetical protein